MAELKSQNLSYAIFSWGNIRVSDWAWREDIVQTESTGAGSGVDTNYTEGRRYRRFSFVGILVDGSPPFATTNGTVKLDLVGDGANVVEGAFKRRRLEFGATQGGGKYWVRGLLLLDGVLTVDGVPVV